MCLRIGGRHNGLALHDTLENYTFSLTWSDALDLTANSYACFPGPSRSDVPLRGRFDDVLIRIFCAAASLELAVDALQQFIGAPHPGDEVRDNTSDNGDHAEHDGRAPRIPGSAGEGRVSSGLALSITETHQCDHLQPGHERPKFDPTPHQDKQYT